MKIYIIRHGLTVWNKQKRTQGRVNNKLAKEGKEELEKIAQKLKNVNFDYIFCSPLLRAVQSANIINFYHKNKIIKDNRLTDFDQGIFTGRFFNTLTQEELTAKKSKSKLYRMESYFELYTRVSSFYEELKQSHQNKTILIVTHSGVASAFQNIINNIPYCEEIYKKTDLFSQGEIKEFIV